MNPESQRIRETLNRHGSEMTVAERVHARILAQSIDDYDEALADLALARKILAEQCTHSVFRDFETHSAGVDDEESGRTEPPEILHSRYCLICDRRIDTEHVAG